MIKREGEPLELANKPDILLRYLGVTVLASLIMASPHSLNLKTFESL